MILLVFLNLARGIHTGILQIPPTGLVEEGPLLSQHVHNVKVWRMSVHGLCRKWLEELNFSFICQQGGVEGKEAPPPSSSADVGKC